MADFSPPCFSPARFPLDLGWEDLPAKVRSQTRLILLDLIGVAAAGMSTRASQIIRDHAVSEFGGPVPILFDGRTASASGAALAGGITLDSLDSHDGYNPAKGHIGCSLFPAMLAASDAQGLSGQKFLTTIAMGYEFGSRASVAQHATCPDYHTSGSWGAVTSAAAAARLYRLDPEQTRHALGIAEYHGPRSQMMRCIDHPTMLKDGSGWGAMAGVSAARLAAAGFTGAPALTVEQAPEFWADLGERWYTLEQYFKAYPVCRWAQAAIEGVLTLKRAHKLTSDMVDHIAVSTFHESTRLATRRPSTTDEAQYSTSFPCAVAMVRGDVTPADIADEALNDPEILRLSESMVMREDPYANEVFPGKRLARIDLHLKTGAVLKGTWMEPRWDHLSPPTEEELRLKFHSLADGALGKSRADAIEDALETLDQTALSALTQHLFQPIKR